MLGATYHESTHGQRSVESRSNANTTESRFSRSTFNSRVRTHGSTFHAAPRPLSHWRLPQPSPPTRTPAQAASHATASTTTRAPKLGGIKPAPAEEPSPSQAVSYSPPKRTAAPKPTAHRATSHSNVRYSRASIHARHLRRLIYNQELKAYHAALRAWRKLITAHDKLIKHLASLERRLLRQQQAKHPATHQAAFIYELNEVWYQQSKSGKRTDYKP